MAITDAVIPVGGLGTRLLPATRSQPKEMLPVVDKPVVQYVTEELARAGVARVLFVTGRRKRAIEDHFDADPELERAVGVTSDPRNGLQMLYTRQPRAAGLGDALGYATGFAERRGVVVALGDTIIVPPPPPAAGIVQRLAEAYESHGACAALAVEQVEAEAVSRYGIVTTAAQALGDGVMDVLDLVEKPRPDEVASRLAIAARYVLGPVVFEALGDTPPDDGGEIQLTDALRALLASGQRIVAVSLAAGERRLDIGTVESYCRAFLELALDDPRIGASLRAALRDD